MVNEIVLDMEYLGGFNKPGDCLDYTKRIGGVCGITAIASLFDMTTKAVFDAWGKDENKFRHFTSQKEMKEIISKLGYQVKQRPIGKNKVAIPEMDLGIIRVSYGEQNQHWMETAKHSHYIGLKKFGDRKYIFDNGFDNFNGKPENGLWVEVSEYWVKVAMTEKMFVTSYLEIMPNICGNCGLRHLPKTICSIQPEEGVWEFIEMQKKSWLKKTCKHSKEMYCSDCYSAYLEYKKNKGEHNA